MIELTLKPYSAGKKIQQIVYNDRVIGFLYRAPVGIGKWMWYWSRPEKNTKGPLLKTKEKALDDFKSCYGNQDLFVPGW